MKLSATLATIIFSLLSVSAQAQFAYYRPVGGAGVGHLVEATLKNGAIRTEVVPSKGSFAVIPGSSLAVTYKVISGTVRTSAVLAKNLADINEQNQCKSQMTGPGEFTCEIELPVSGNSTGGPLLELQPDGVSIFGAEAVLKVVLREPGKSPITISETRIQMSKNQTTGAAEYANSVFVTYHP